MTNRAKACVEPSHLTSCKPTLNMGLCQSMDNVQPNRTRDSTSLFSIEIVNVKFFTTGRGILEASSHASPEQTGRHEETWARTEPRFESSIS
jgi:hypothetical protein